MDNDCRLVDGGPIACCMLGVEDELDDLAAGRDIFGLNSLSPFEGDNAEKRWW